METRSAETIQGLANHQNMTFKLTKLRASNDGDDQGQDDDEEEADNSDKYLIKTTIQTMSLH